MQTGSKMDTMVPVRLSDDDIRERGELLAQKNIQIGALRKKRREQLRSINAQIESDLDECDRLSRIIQDGVEARKQGDLFVGDQVVRDPAATQEATEVLAEVAAMTEERPTRYHGDGALCKRDTCRRRRHLTLEQCQTNGIVAEGQPIGDTGELAPAPEDREEEPESDGPPQCVGCNEELTAMEIVKKLGLCEKCQLQKPEEVNVREPEASSEVDEIEAVAEAIEPDGPSADVTEDVDFGEDPRPRCSECHGVLTPDEVSAELGMCSTCVDKATSGTEGAEAVQG